MVGTPAETRQTFYKTLERILKLELDLLTVNSFTPFPGTLDYQRADKYGKFKRDWALLNEHNLVFIPYGLTEKQVEYFIRMITKRFYLRPKILWKYIKMGSNPTYFKILFEGFISFLKFVNNPIEK